MDEPSDDALLQAWAAGDAAAFERLYARHQAGLYRFVRRLLGTPLAAQADEVFQEAWLRVLALRGRWQPQAAACAGPAADGAAEAPVTGPGDGSGDGSEDGADAPAGRARFRTWLYTVAHHRAIDLWRRSGREVPLEAGDDAAAPWSPDGEPWQAWPEPPDGAPSAAEALFWRRAGERLLACLEELPLPQRSVFLLHHEDGLSLGDAAQAAGVGFETAKTRLRYAMAKLRACMGAYLAPVLGAGASAEAAARAGAGAATRIGGER
ncbi:sigma-70 family RNA polymerase sigma factor [Piscinibacter sakaiensis]|uniref:sigma-70 family RNA polymerase sigma factor n=1 Tax=Piscinibacter sakaiensis TaxID=1547922 RepID=UPI00350E50ED